MLSDLGGEPLNETILIFNIEFRIEELSEAVAADKAGRLERVRPLLKNCLIGPMKCRLQSVLT